MARAQFPPEQRALERVLNGERLEAGWFAPTLLAEVPLVRWERLRADLVEGNGAFRGASRAAGEAGRWRVVLERATVPVQISLDEQERITSLVFERPIGAFADPVAAATAIGALPGTAALLVRENAGRERMAVNADALLGTASAAKMLVLRELANAVAAGRLDWGRVVELQSEWRAPGAGIARGWPPGTPVTLGALAALMIAISDNTATDALIAAVGRDRIDAAAPARLRPLPTMREWLALRYAAPASVVDRWRAAAAAGAGEAAEAKRRQILAALPPGVVATPGPGRDDIDYRFTARELCELIESVGDLPVMRIEPGIAGGLGWDWAAYKQGWSATSESHVALVGVAERRVCVAAVWNNPDGIERTRFATLVRGLLAALLAAGPIRD